MSAREIKTALGRVEAAFTRKPKMAFSTNCATARIDDGLKCITREGDWELVSDMPEIMGGTRSGPSPGALNRAGIASCAAMSIRMHAAMRDVEVRSINVTVEMDWDDRGALGMEGSPAGVLNTRMQVVVDSPAPEVEVRQLVESALGSSPVVENHVHAQAIEMKITVCEGA